MPACELVHLSGGIVVPRPACELVLTLEHSGVTLTLDGPDIVIEGAVSAEILAEIRRWKPHVIMLLNYTADDSLLRDAAPPAPAQVSARHA